MEKKIKVLDVINSNFAVSSTKGALLRDEILKEFDNYDDIYLDFTDVKAVITAFLNVAYGELFFKKNKSLIRKKIHFTNISETTKKLMETVEDLVDLRFKEEE